MVCSSHNRARLLHVWAPCRNCASLFGSPKPPFPAPKLGFAVPLFSASLRDFDRSGFWGNNGGLSKADLGAVCHLRAPCRNHSSPFGLPKPPFPAPKLGFAVPIFSASLGDFTGLGFGVQNGGLSKLDLCSSNLLRFTHGLLRIGVRELLTAFNCVHACKVYT